MSRAVLGALLAAALLAACGGSDGEPAAAKGTVSDLTSVDQLRSAFEADEGTARLVLLLSPT